MKALAAILLLALLGCQHPKVHVQQTEEETAAPLASTVHTGDPKSAAQLVAGFHSIEENAWRWTERKFAVVLSTPFGAAQKGATLEVKLSVAPATIERLHAISLSVAINGTTLPPETWRQPGNYTYLRPVPPALLTGSSVRVDCELDKALPPSGADQRELGVVVLSVGLK
ncbi:MAG: hypothetical protein LAP87_04760 [Acidobacteriia bacterium]|nr:hypothetical protein [Terriglobia bacterium]